MPTPKPTPIPLLLTLGFAAGIGFGYLAFHQEKSKIYVAPPLEVKAAPPSRDAGTLGAIEITFERWGGYAVWENDVTEIAGWDPRRKRHTDFFEVRRANGNFYFRTIPALTRPLIQHGVRTTMPFWFTETQEMKERFVREIPDYDWTKAPLVDLPPKPPQRYTPPSLGGGYAPTSPRPPILTVGPGGDA
ncbi:MAG: hypothetical protein C0518_08740 [Opitutus sp.]|nr:hypothetical protein [Opitutus sp.]